MEEHEAPTIRIERRKSLINMSCCFSRSETFDLSPSFSPSNSRGTPSKWNLLPTFLSPQHENGPPALQEQIAKKYRSFVSRNKGQARRRQASFDFSYDPLSYSLNFEEDKNNDLYSGEFEDNARRRDFSSRLPMTPPRYITKNKSFDDFRRIGSTLGETMTPSIDKSVSKEPCVEKSALRAQSIEKSATKEPFIDKSTLRQRSIDKSALREPSTDKSTLRAPSIYKPALRESSIEKSALRAAAVAEVRKSLEQTLPTSATKNTRHSRHELLI